MFSRFRKFLKDFDEKILTKEEEKPKVNFKGQRVDQRPGAPHLTKEQFESQFKLDPEIRMQSRKLRLKNAGYLMLFGAWYVGCIYYIMYRLRSDDLETLEKEANERLRIKKQVQQNARD